MIAELRKTATRTGHYLTRSLVCREPYQDQVLVVWLLVFGLFWVLLSGQVDQKRIAYFALSVALASLLAAICAIDARFGIIPNKLVGAMAACGLAGVFLLDPDEVMYRIAEVVIVAIAMAAFRAVYRWVRGYDGLGFGDVKFLAAATFWIGLRSLPALLLIAVVSALASAFLLRSARYEVDGRHAIPFGPHLAVGLWLAWVFDPMSYVLG
ncbi:prepilin peptidase [Bradyrhizobium sp. GCM10023182]|uniref:A24 family peptidase n=1 Tax=Bradyrhizobium zhengyangense TaxID=2911009 RepID=A0ABS9M0K2_9BRAD|nr:A24 family peptidase [Bradyrhizobium zhengyangense]MCG2672817.1 A24 family peptidase [Bradyrhizobium zhengyangense]